ncbi:MAG: hypothetical protein L6R40_000438 [Gallowayella cf. fulva]|nr:MAG: hypothetical protein L6R40_000438 [Xanthomendoza cf. fulva]
MSHHTSSSPPSLPPLSELVDKMAHPENRNRAINFPREASAASNSARSLFQRANSKERKTTQCPNEELRSDFPTNLQDSNGKTKKMSAERSGKVNENPDQPRAPRKSAVTSRSKRSADSELAEDAGNVRTERVCEGKKQSRKPRKDNQTKIKRAKITKPDSGSIIRKRPNKISTENVSGIPVSGAETRENVNKAKDWAAVEEEPDLGLIEAVRRRKDWTPTKDTSKGKNLPHDIEAAWSALIPLNSPTQVITLDEGFLNRLGEFGYSNTVAGAASTFHAPRNSKGEAATKKRKLDFVASINTAATPNMVSIKKTRSPKKKPQTITDKATAPFLVDDEASTSTLLDYFADPSQGTLQCTSMPAQNQIGNNRHHETQQKQPRKRKSIKPKLDKIKEVVVLHPPEFAVKVANEQDLLFGTSSQLARDESPTFIRDLQQAFKESEAVDNSHHSSQANGSQLSALSLPSISSKTRLPSVARNMWSVAARDDEGHLLNVDVVDLIDTPRASRCSPTMANPIGAAEVTSGPDVASASTSTASTIATFDSGRRAVDDISGAEPAVLPLSTHQEAEHLLPRSVAEASLRQRPKSKSPVKMSKPWKDPKPLMLGKNSLPEMPNFNVYTDVELAKAVSDTGFKNIKKREDKIAHLQECWNESQSRRALKSLPSNTSGHSKPAKSPTKEATRSTSPQKKRGRPSKNLSATTNDDGGTATGAASLKKPRGRPKKTAPAQSPKAKTQTQSHPAIDENLATLFPIITKAVRNFPPTNDLLNLTWYEKMLLYDPIVLEDLADWLNTVGLSRVGCGDTVNPVVAKMWCESQSVCCLWRENLRGGTRSRH